MLNDGKIVQCQISDAALDELASAGGERTRERQAPIGQGDRVGAPDRDARVIVCAEKRRRHLGRIVALSIIPTRDVQTSPAHPTRGNASAGDGDSGFVT
jgi:hypothetical protein